MATNNKNTDIEFEEKVRKSEQRQKRMTQIVCLVLAALMVLGGTVTAIITALAG